MLDKVYELLEEEFNKEVEIRVFNIRKENKFLRESYENKLVEIKELRQKLADYEYLNNCSVKALEFIQILKKRVMAAPKENRRDCVYNFLKTVFYVDYDEQVYDARVPLWLGACTQFYSNKETVIDLLRCLEVEKLPDNVDDFRLPIDWTEEELDVFFETMPKHVNCNGCYFEDNLKFWSHAALYPVEKQCKCETYSEIPWQFVLRNPNLLKEKFLIQVGKHAFTKTYSPYQWRHFFKIEQYQKLTDEQIKIIINNIDNESVKFDRETDTSLKYFLLRHVDLVDSDELVNKIYEEFKDSYEFRYIDALFKFPDKFMKDHVKNTREGLEWIKRHAKKLTAEQRSELALIALSVEE